MNKQSPAELMKSAAQTLAGKYKRPPAPEGVLVKDEQQFGLRVCVTNISEKSGAGSETHTGKWVQIQYDPSSEVFRVYLFMDGVSGHPDKKSTYSLEAATGDGLAAKADDYMKTYRPTDDDQ